MPKVGMWMAASRRHFIVRGIISPVFGFARMMNSPCREIPMRQFGFIGPSGRTNHSIRSALPSSLALVSQELAQREDL
jgi:hypothetical protein